MTEQKNRIWGIALKDGTYKMYVAEYDQWSFSVIAECVAFNLK